MKIVYIGGGERLSMPTVVCLGFFDGVHVGHRRLVERAMAVGEEKNLAVCVHTYDRMPAKVIDPALAILELTELSEKAALLASLGVQVLAVSRFDEAMMRMSAEAFFVEVLLGEVSARHLVAGFHHRFGHRGEADTRTLERLCGRYGVGLDIIPPVSLEEGELISSSAIRALVRTGELEKAERMLGRPWRRETDA